MQSIPVALCANERYSHGLMVAAASIVLHTAADQPIDFHVLDLGLAPSTMRRLELLVRRYSPSSRIRRLVPDVSLFRDCPSLQGNHAAYTRLLLPHLVDHDRILYFDVDMLILKDVRDLWDADMGDHLALAVFEPGVTLGRDCSWLAPDDPEYHLPYFNSGAMVMHLEQWRTRNLDADMRRLVNTHATELSRHDQTILNYLLAPRTGRLDGSWNTFCVGRTPPAAYMPSDGVVIHITHVKPWNNFRDLTGWALWFLFHDMFVDSTPAILRFGTLRRTRKLSNFVSALHSLVSGIAARTDPGAAWLLRRMATSRGRVPVAHWLERWIDLRRSRRPDASIGSRNLHIRNTEGRR